MGEKPFIPIESHNAEYKQFFDRIFRFKDHNQWSIWYCGFKQVISAKFVITKFVRSNNLLPWFVNTFEFDFKPVFLLRHPIPTTLSVIKSFANNSSELLDFKLPNTLNNYRYIPHTDYINSLKTRLEQQIAIWCIDNIEIVNHKDNDKWLTIYYEDFMLENEISNCLSKDEYLKKYSEIVGDQDSNTY